MEPEYQQKADLVNSPNSLSNAPQAYGPATELEVITTLFNYVMGKHPESEEIKQVSKEYGSCGGMCFLEFGEYHLGSMLKHSEGVAGTPDLYIFWPPKHRD